MSDDAAISSALEAKLVEVGMDKTPEEFIEGLDPQVRRCVDALKDLSKKREEIEKQFMRERSELDAKYEKLYGPLYAERAQVVSGSKAVPVPAGEPAGSGIKGIPDFWTTVLLKCHMTNELIQGRDLEVLSYLTDIQCESFIAEGAPTGFKLLFLFAENPFFTNKVLEKAYLVMPAAEGDGVNMDKSTGTKINWKAGKDVTVRVVKKKAKKGGKPDKGAKLVESTEKSESFFNFFNDVEIPGEDEEIDEAIFSEVQERIELDIEIGEAIREKLVSQAVSWYTGEAEPNLFGGQGFGDEDGDEGEDEDSSDDEDEDEEEEEEAPAAKGGKQGKNKHKKAKKGEKPPECKQQ